MGKPAVTFTNAQSGDSSINIKQPLGLEAAIASALHFLEPCKKSKDHAQDLYPYDDGLSVERAARSNRREDRNVSTVFKKEAGQSVRELESARSVRVLATVSAQNCLSFGQSIDVELAVLLSEYWVRAC